MITYESPARRGRDLRSRYTAADLAALTHDEARRFVPDGGGDPQTDVTLAWELLYRLEPELYQRMASAEKLHRSVVGWLPSTADRIVEVGAGTGRPDTGTHRARARGRGDRAREDPRIDPGLMNSDRP